MIHYHETVHMHMQWHVLFHLHMHAHMHTMHVHMHRPDHPSGSSMNSDACLRSSLASLDHHVDDITSGSATMEGYRHFESRNLE